MSSTQQLLLTEGGGAIPNYIEDVFSTYLYTGNGSTQTITNNIDLSTKGGMVWLKDRNQATSHWLRDTARPIAEFLSSNNSNAATNYTSAGISSWNTNGFSLFGNAAGNESGQTEVSWTFRKQPKFFDVVTYTGNGGGGYVFNHNLQSRPGFIIIKAVGASSNWFVWHRGTSVDSTTNALSGFALNSTSQSTDAQPAYGVTDTVVNVYYIHDQSGNIPNDSGVTYVAYLFAHNAGGFGLTGSDNVISCGSFTTNGSGNATVNLGYEPQWFLAKSSSTTQDWFVVDSMRGWVNGGANDNDALLRPNLSNAEFVTNFGEPTATGFNLTGFTASQTYIYIAIRRGPMKVPTDATKVFKPIAYTGTNTTGQVITTNFPVDLVMPQIRQAGYSSSNYAFTRLQGGAKWLDRCSTSAEGGVGSTYGITAMPNTSYTYGVAWQEYTTSGNTYVSWAFQRASSFCDVVCYTGNGSSQNITHNLGVTPELMIVKCRSDIGHWGVYSASLGNTQRLILNLTNAAATASDFWNNTSPTTTQFTVGSNSTVNASTYTFVAYLFATCPGVSKVGSYTGTGTLTTINCGFTGGARYVLIKRTDSASDWFIWDTARGMVAGTDPYMASNTSSGDVSGDSVYTVTTGFQLLASPSADVNTNGGTYIYLAIA